MNEEVRRHRIVRKLLQFSRGKRNPASLQGGCSRQRILHLLVISLYRSPGVLSSTGTFPAYNLGLITTHLPQLASSHHYRIRMRGMQNQVSKSMRRDSQTLSRAPPTAPSCSKMKSGRSTKEKNLVRGSRRRKKRAWTEMTKMIATTQDRRDTLGNVQGLGRAP